MVTKMKMMIKAAVIRFIGKMPPKEMPQALLDKYSMDGKVQIEKWYFNDVGLSFIPKFYTCKKIASVIELIENRKCLGYSETNEWFYQAMDNYSVKDKTCVVIGSTMPFYESSCLYFGAKEITTIEYNKLFSCHPKIKTIRPSEYDKNPTVFDVGFSISSFEHDGLGRYGDPIDPDADLQAMQKMKKVVKKEGILFLSVPVGKDMVVWNAHRVYGKNRLNKLLNGWHILDTFGFEESRLEIDNKQGRYQPIFVLKNI